MAPFSEYATHVKVAEEDEPTTVESAILRSMMALGSSSSVLSEDGTSYECGDDCDNEENNRNPLLIVEDIDEGSNAKMISRQLKNNPSNSPMTPRQLLYLGGIWYLPAENHRKNEELQLQEAVAAEAEKVQNEAVENSSNSGGNARKKQKYKNGSDKMVKPRRLSLADASMALCNGDYLRIHHTPRRYNQIYKVDWSFPSNETKHHEKSNQVDSDDCSTASNERNSDVFPLVVQQQGPGYCIIDKPPIIPVHATVDNAAENVAHQLYLALELQEKQQDTTSFDREERQDDTTSTISHSQLPNQEESTYLAPVQRLDVNTSGLMVMATSPEFAAYFSQLLRHKTATILDHGNNASSNNATGPSIEKGYKCLVCIQPDESSGESVLQAWKRLFSLQRPKPQNNSSPITTTVKKGNIDTNSTRIIRHFLQASDRAPKLFVDRIPDGDDDSKWYECLMEITDVGEPVPLYASNSQDGEKSPNLAEKLWPKDKSSGFSRIPSTAKAVVEVQVSLITGRTHQIRGQLSKLGFPIVGDEQYGGASPLPKPSETETKQQEPEDLQLLSLQCCQLGFRDAEYESVFHKKKRRDILRGRPNRSGRWVHATLQNAWWTPFLEAQVGKDGNQFSDIDFQDVVVDDSSTEAEENSDTVIDVDARSTLSIEIRPDMLPPSVQLSPGCNKYVVAKLRDPSTNKLRWFVQSAPMPYHAEVAFDLLEWISAVPGYDQTRVEVTGGGRIDYNPSRSTVNIYGFSYRYGKGDHARVANLIENSNVGTDLTVSFDLSDNLY